MAQLDPSIFLQTRPKSAFDYLQEFAAADQQRQQSQLQKLQLLGQQRAFDDAEQARGVRNRAMSAMQALGGNATIDQRIGAADSVGAYDIGDALRKRQNEESKARDESYKARAEVAGKFLGMQRDLAGFVIANPTRENATAAVQRMQALAQSLGQDVDLSQELAAIAQLQTPDDIKKWAAGHALQAEKLLPQLQTRNLGGTTETMAVDPVTGQVRVTNVAKNTQSPDSVASVAATMRGQNLADARAREGNEIQRSAARSQVVETPDGVMIVDKGTGLARPAATMNGKPLPGKPSESTKKALTEINQQRSVVQGAIDAVQKTPSAFGLTRGAATLAGGVAESVAGRFDSDAERQARSYVFNNVSKVINERAGAAQSAQELARLRSFLPAETDSSEQIVSKLKAYQSYLNDLESGTTGSSGAAAKPAPKQDFSGWSIEKVD